MKQMREDGLVRSGVRGEKSDMRIALHFVSHVDRVLILVLTHHPLPECLLEAMTRMRVKQKERQSSVGKEKGVRSGHRGKSSFQAANGALRKWLPTEAGPAVLCGWQSRWFQQGQQGSSKGKARTSTVCLTGLPCTEKEFPS